LPADCYFIVIALPWLFTALSRCVFEVALNLEKAKTLIVTSRVRFWLRFFSWNRWLKNRLGSDGNWCRGILKKSAVVNRELGLITALNYKGQYFEGTAQ